MRSPFAIFRKHQKLAMVILTVMAMFAFVVLDTISQVQGPLPPVLLILVIAPLLAGVGWLLGVRGGHAKEFALFGALAGVALGWIIPQLNAPAPAVETELGDISREELQRMMQNRSLANQFLQRAFAKAMGDQAMGMMYPMWQQQWLFQFDRPLDEDVVLGYLYRQEAEALGIDVSDAAVIEYIKQATNDKLSSADFREIRSEMRISEATLFDIMREELQARRARDFLFPRSLPTPGEYWELYQKLHVREALDVAAVPVEAFTAKVAEPAESQLLAHFERYKNVFPMPGLIQAEPAFGQPPKVRLAYFEADYEAVEKEVPAVTDAEIEAFYEQNKHLYRNQPAPEESAGEANPLDPDFTPEPGAEGESTTPVEAPRPTPPEGGGSTGSSADGAAESSTAEPAAAETSAAETPAAETPAAETPAAETPAAEPAAESAAGETPAEAAQPATETPEEPLPEYQPLDDELRDEIRDQLLNERTQKAMEQKIERALAFMFEISDKYHSGPAEGEEEQEAEEEVGKKAEPTPGIPPAEIDQRMRKYAAEHGLKYVATDLVTAEQLMNPEAPEELSIGGATEPVESEIERTEARTVLSMLFGDQGKRLYMANEAQDFGMSKRYAFWKTEEVPARVPEFDDPGMREAVLAAWKREQARPLAEERAKALAETVRESTQGMLETLGGQTITGDEGSQPLALRETEQFSWLRQSSAPQLNFFAPPPPPAVSPISAIDHVSDELMKTLFNDLGEGDVGVVPNADRSTFYVVMVKNRSPSTPGAEEAQRQAFLRENLFAFTQFAAMASPYAVVMSGEQSEAYMRWSRKIEEMYGARINVPAPEEL